MEQEMYYLYLFYYNSFHHYKAFQDILLLFLYLVQHHSKYINNTVNDALETKEDLLDLLSV